MEGYWLIVFACIAIGVICKALQGRKEAELLERNPEAWKAMKAAQADEQERKRNAMGKAAKGGFAAARILLNKYRK